jgi:hypothetical protein
MGSSDETARLESHKIIMDAKSLEGITTHHHRINHKTQVSEVQSRIAQKHIVHHPEQLICPFAAFVDTPYNIVDASLADLFSPVHFV